MWLQAEVRQRLGLLRDIATGLSFLHNDAQQDGLEPAAAHTQLLDLRNVLLESSSSKYNKLRARIGGFGQAVVRLTLSVRNTCGSILLFHLLLCFDIAASLFT